MKKLLIFLFVLFPLLLEGQMIIRASTNARVRTAAAFCAEYQTVYDEYTDLDDIPSATVAAADNTMVEALVDAGYWARFDIFYVPATSNNSSGGANIEWKSAGASYTLVPGYAVSVPTPTWTTLEGYKCAASEWGQLNTQWNPSSNGSNFTQNAASIGFYSRTSGVEGNGSAWYAGSGTYFISSNIRSGAGSMDFRLNDNSYATIATSSTQGLFVVVRTASNSVTLYHNGASDGNAATNSTGRPNYNLYFLNWPGTASYSVQEQVSVIFAGDKFDATEMAEINTTIEARMDAIGKGVQ